MAGFSVNRSDHEADRLEGVEPPSVFRPEDSVLELAAVDTPTVPHPVQVGLAAGVVPPPPLVEVGAVTCRGKSRRSAGGQKSSSRGPGNGAGFPTGEGVLVPVQGGELFAVVAAEGVASVALVGAEPQPVALPLRLDVEAAVLGVHLLPGPVLQLDHQLVVALLPQVVDVFQPDPVLAVDVSKPFLERRSVCSSLFHHTLLRLDRLIDPTMGK